MQLCAILEALRLPHQILIPHKPFPEPSNKLARREGEKSLASLWATVTWELPKWCVHKYITYMYINITHTHTRLMLQQLLRLSLEKPVPKLNLGVLYSPSKSSLRRHYTHMICLAFCSLRNTRARTCMHACSCSHTLLHTSVSLSPKILRCLQ